MRISEMETRFKEVTGLVDLDLSLPTIPRNLDSRQKTSKEETKLLGFVPTPLWLVDEMLEPEMGNLSLESKTCDSCAGCGQFTIRMLRKLKCKFPHMDEEHWLKTKHWFTEFQFSNVAKLVYIFGPNINVYAGDSLNMKYVKEKNENGLLFFNEKRREWMNIPNLQPEIERRKDSLSDLITVFTVLESAWNTINAMKN